MLEKLELFLLRLSMQTPFGHARATRDVTENLVAIAHIDGFEGAGEGVPRDYVTGETSDEAFDAIVKAAPRFDEAFASLRDGVTAIESAQLPERFAQHGKPGQAAACAVELAMLDALCRKFNRPLRAAAQELDLKHAHLRDAAHDVPVTRVLDFNRTLDGLDAMSKVYHHLKIKVGRSEDEDDARIAEARARVGPKVPISLDANMAWDLPTACGRVARFARHDIAWYEEPLQQRDWDSYGALRQQTGAKVMLDESACTREDVAQAIASQACDIINIRLSKCGGFLASCRMAEQASAAKLAFQLGAQVGQTGILWSAGRHFASTFRDLVAYEGGGSRKTFAESITALEPFVDPATFKHRTPEGPGLGTSVVRRVLEASIRRRATWTSEKGWQP